MKIFIISIFTLLTFSPFNNLYSQYTVWENISDQIPGDSLNILSDVSVSNRWAGFISSMTTPEIYRGEFSGGNWEVLQTPSPVSTFYMRNYDYGFMCGADSTVYQTTDAGESWIYFGSLGEQINDIDFTLDWQASGYICGYNGAFGSITDTGLVNLNSGLTSNFSSLSSPTKDNVWLASDSSVYYYNGNTFIKQFSSTVLLNSINFINNSYGIVVGDSGYIARTSDGGTTWIQNQNPDTLKRNLNDIHLTGPYGWAVGDEGIILFTTDAGETWVIDTDWLTPNKTALIWPLVVSVDDKPITIVDFELFQNYPNPFNPTTIIKYKIPELSYVTIKVFDVLGNEIETLVNDEKSTGSYEVGFDGTNLTSGIYFCQLRVGDYTDTKKMILLR